jgi:uncharacterized protein (TIGR03437 family)
MSVVVPGTDVAMAAHEGGHNLGLQHAYSRAYAGSALGAPGDTGTRTEYNDPFSNMGNGNSMHYTARQKLQLGWLAPEEVITTDGPGSFTLLPLSSQASGPKALRVHRPGTDSDWLWIESRQPVGSYESSLPANFGRAAVLHYEDRLILDSMGAKPADLLDFTPHAYNPSDFRDAALTAGRTWIDSWTGLSITTARDTADGLTVSIQQTKPCATFAEQWRRQDGAGGTGTIQVNADAGCSWTITGLQPWIDSIVPIAGAGSATVRYHAAANDTVKVRRAVLTMSGTLFTIVQDGTGVSGTEVIPASGKGYEQTFTFVYGVPDGATLTATSAVFNLGSRYCSVAMLPDEGRIGLQTEVGSSPFARPDAGGAIEMPNCSLDVSGTSFETKGGKLYVRAPLRFARTFAGAADVELWAYDPNTNVWGKYRLGSWTIGTDEGAAPAITAAGVVNAASHSAGPLAPGEMVTIFGTGLGPREGVTAPYDSSGRLGLTAGGTSVFFDNVQAPLVFASEGQVSAVVPYAAAGSTRLRVDCLGRSSNEIALPVAASAPGIFTGEGTRAIAFNQSGSLNAISAPAARGEIITFYATGQGQTNPAGVDGKVPIAPNWPIPAQGVSVTIGGIDAELVFKGVVSPGLLQVNAKVPDASPVGDSIPIVLKVGSTSSDAAAVAIR